MTKEEAIDILQSAIKKPNTKDGYLGQAIDMAIKALEQERSRLAQITQYRNDCEKLMQENEQLKKALEQEPMRDATPEERESVDKYIKSISKPTRVDFWNLKQEPKIGHWIKMFLIDTSDIDGQCSECSFIHKFIDGHTAQYNYCPNCGAKMESEEK